MQVNNRISIALGNGPDERLLSDIHQIVIHHTVAERSVQPNVTSANLEAGWRTNPGMGAPNARGGYHELILFNGNVDRNMQDRRRTWGAANQNNHTWHISLVGTHSATINNITQTQLNSLANRIAAAMQRFGWTANNVDRIVRHRDLPGHANTTCTHVNLTNVRNAVRAILSGTQVPSPPQAGTFAIGTFNADVRMTQTANVRAERNTSSAILGQLQSGTIIRVGTILGRNNSNPAYPLGSELWGGITFNGRTGFISLLLAEPVSTSNLIRIGDRVQIRATATTWATGETIPAWARNSIFTVTQFRNNNQEALLSDVISWIRVIQP
ncbi:MAG: amidase [Streptococcaceae bacterium]|nr:amidase [Streptococcaceae bacterium]